MLRYVSHVKISLQHAMGSYTRHTGPHVSRQYKEARNLSHHFNLCAWSSVHNCCLVLIILKEKVTLGRYLLLNYILHFIHIIIHICRDEFTIWTQADEVHCEHLVKRGKSNITVGTSMVMFPLDRATRMHYMGL